MKNTLIFNKARDTKCPLLLSFFVFICLMTPLFAYSESDIYLENLGGQTIESNDWSVSASVTYLTGDYSTGTITSTTYVPLTIKRHLPKGSLAVTVPYIYQETGPGVTAIGGIPFVTDPNASGPKQKASGLGDVILKGTYYLLTEDSAFLNLSPVVRIKVPTADDDEGLGTGEFDETAGFETNKTLTDQWSFNFNAYYTFLGQPEGQDLDNEITVNLGPDYRLNENTTLSLAYEERTTLVSSKTNPREVIFNIMHKLKDSKYIFGGISAGLSNTSPDVGATLGLNCSF